MDYNTWLQNNFGHWASPVWGPILIFGGVIIAVAVVWSLVWKGMALWKAARNGDTAWFVVLLIVNTVGILEILYIYVFSKKSSPAVTV
jgi:hypothetical protein